MKSIRTAIFGTGFMGRVHLEAVRRVESVEAAAIAGRNVEVARRLGAGFSISSIVADYREILRDPAIDAVHICTPNARHFPMAKDALHAGKHVLCEKPLATSVAEGEELVALAAQKACVTASVTTCATTPWCSRCERCARPETWEKSLSSRARIPRTGFSTTRTGTGASRPKPADLRAAWPISPRTGLIWRSMSQDCA